MKINLERLHHAYLLEGDRQSVLSELFDFLDLKLKVQRKGNPNFYLGEFDTLTIDDGRMLKEMQINKVEEGEKQIFVVAFNSITREAQNSLLKVFEEPSANTHFFVITPNASTLLPTLLSRLEKIETSIDSSNNQTREGERFLKLSKADRIQYIKELMEDIKEEKKEKREATRILLDLEKILSTKINLSKATVVELKNLETIIESQDFASDKSASLKMILENIALSI